MSAHTKRDVPAGPDIPVETGPSREAGRSGALRPGLGWSTSKREIGRYYLVFLDLDHGGLPLRSGERI